MRMTYLSRTIAVLLPLALVSACSRAESRTEAEGPVPPATPVVAASAAGAASATGVTAPPGSPVAIVYKSPTCGCCAKWVDHMRESGFQVEVRDTVDVMPVKIRHKLPVHLASCHTAMIGGYVVEGHVPADVVRRLLAERPAVTGIAVPGMPMGSPGMEGFRKDPYDVIAYRRDGTTQVYTSR